MPHPPHPALFDLTRDLHARKLSRREFLTRATALGLTASAALGLSGAPQTARADTSIARGGTLRIQQLVKELHDPRLYDWSEKGNQTRGFLEYLVQLNRDGTLQGMLLESWEANADATRYVLHLRPDVTWSNGDGFTAEDVVHNFTRWCDTATPGNSMTSRLVSLIDPQTGQMRAEAVTVEDDLTLTLSLGSPDIALIANLSDYPAAVMHRAYAGENPFDFGIGTGPYRPVENIPGTRCILERDQTRAWWGAEVYGGPFVDRVEFLDYGTDPSSWLAAAENDEIDLLYESVGNFIDVLDTIGWTRTETESAATMVIRCNARAEIDGQTPYANAATRRALALAVDNEICLELGYAGFGEVAANDHVSPIHPAHAEIGPPEFDPVEARRLLSDAGMADFEHELITIDDEWQRNTGDAVAALLQDAGIKTRRTIVPGAEFWQNWQTYPFSATQWNHRPLDVQVLSLAYRSNAVWNETGFADPEFDTALDRAMALGDADSRREIMRELQTRMRDQGVIIQPYWRRLYNHHNGRLVGADRHPSNEIHVCEIGFTA
ncbi:ABC transporter substrate-binding protein [Roseovarius aestuariivivens]|uniref:ABC transporter substrate-binding protein n=1 Tax=Roseovarius aestuariivivens TaxID=1888910 RepID=UPI001080E0D2|nr:ABC transporter substrate-binding protein [Roseovarius aestuariivivens]